MFEEDYEEGLRGAYKVGERRLGLSLEKNQKIRVERGKFGC